MVLEVRRTGKTSCVARSELLRAGIDPANILAITFPTADDGWRAIVPSCVGASFGACRRRWLGCATGRRHAISTIDAFCLSLLREFPLEADVDPAFDLANETEVPRLIASSLDRTLRILVGQARSDTDIALVLAQLGISRTREGLATLLDRRLVAWDAPTLLPRGPRD